MKKNINDNKDELKQLFKHIKWEEPSAQFENQLMANIHQLAERKKRKEAFSYWLIITAACVLLTLTTLVLLWVLDLDFISSLKYLFYSMSQGVGIYLTSIIGIVLLISIHAYLRKRLYDQQ